MEKSQINKFIKIFGWIIFFLIFVISGLCRLFLRDYYSKGDEEFVLLILFGLGIVYLILRFIFDKERFIEEVNTIANNLKKRWPEIVVITLVFVLWYFYKRNGY